MSRRSIDLGRMTRRVRIYLGSRHVAADVLLRWNDRRLRGVRETFGVASDFEAALGALATALDSLASAGDLRGLTCDTVIADCWVMYEVVGLDVTQVSRQSANAALAATLADVAGTRADALELSWQWQRDGRSVLAMAIERDRLVRLRAILERAGVAVRCITGEFVAVFNRQRAQLSGPRAVLAVSRDAGAQVALLREGAIRCIGFDVGCGDSAALVRAAINATRARGEDTTADVHYVVDPGEPPEDRREHEHYDADGGTSPDRWHRVIPPDWATAPAPTAD